MRLALGLVLLLTVSCARGTPSNPILPPGVSPTALEQPGYVGIGRYQKITEITQQSTFGGIPFALILEVRQAPGTSILHRDTEGLLYSVQGPHLMRRDDGDRVAPREIPTGNATWVMFDTEHLNDRQSDDFWYFMSLRSIAQRQAQLPYPSYRVLVSSPDLVTLPTDKPIVHQLGLITMKAGGRTSSHSHGGVEAVYVMKGTVELVTNDRARTKLSAGQGAAVPPRVVMQLHVVGDQDVEVLSYTATPEGAAWQTNLQTLP